MENPMQQDMNEQAAGQQAPALHPIGQEVRQFYQQNLMALISTFFRDPINGLMELFRNAPANAATLAGILLATVFVLYFAGSYLAVGDLRDYMGFADFLAIGALPVLVMLTIATFSFLIKLIAGGNAQFKSELLTGALCGIPLALVVVAALMFRVLGEDVNIISIFQSPFVGGNVMMIFSVYILMVMFNVFQQSLRAAGIRDSHAWYLAPVSIMLALFIGFSITQNVF